MPKQPHAAVHYRPAILLWFSKRRCGTCAMYLRGESGAFPVPHCSAVLDPIYNAGDCDIYAPKKGK